MRLDVERLRRRLPAGAMRTAFERWWSTSGEDSARDILAPRWIRLCRKHRRRAEPQILYRFFALLAEVEVERVPSVPMTAALFRTVIRFPETAAWMELEALVRASSSPEALNSGWRFLHQRLQEGRARRHASRVTFDDAHDLLVRVAAALEGGSEPTLLRSAPDAGNAFTASTDGKQVTLPAAIELTPHRELNLWGYVRLLGHELEHIAGGSFVVEGEPAEKQALERRLAPRRQTFEQNAASWSGDVHVRAIRAAGGQLPEFFQPSMPELSRVFLHFPSPDAFHGLYNLVEDVRVEQRLAEKYPGVGRIAEILHGYEVAATRSPVLETHHRNFLRALQERANGWTVTGYIGKAYRRAWLELGLLLDTLRADLRGAAAIRSLIAAADIYAILERTIKHRSAIDQELHRNAGAAVEMVIYNRQAGSPEFFDKERSVAVEYPTAKEGVPAGGRWQAYPEYDAWREVLVQEAAKVQEIKWRPTRKPTALVSMDVSHATLPAARQIESARRRLSYANSGLELEPSRTHDFVSTPRRPSGA